MSVSLSAERDRLQQQVEELEQSLSMTPSEQKLLSSDPDDESDHDVTNEREEQSTAGLLALREQVQKEIQNLETVLGTEDGSISDDYASSSEESELSLSADSCLQMNLVYQQVVQETLDQLETLMAQNNRQQKELMSQLSGPTRQPSKEQPPSSSASYQQPSSLYLGRFLKPYFKDKMTGLGPPANQETKEKSGRMTGCLDDKKLKLKRWESWQKTLLIHSVTRDSLRRLIQPKLSRVDYLTQKLSSTRETERQQLREQIDSLEKEIDQLKARKEEELIGDRYEEHDWQKISNIDFEGTRDADDICRFWQNFLHPSINKTKWSQEEVQQLKQLSAQHGERNWTTIAEELGTGRTAFMCLQTFQRFVSDSLRHSSWTPAEDALLRELVDRMRIGNFIPYTQMSYFMEGRDPAQLIYRWNQVLDPSLKKGPWTKQEDQLLLDAVSRYGEKNWWKIRLEVPGRTDSACRDRYHDSLKAGLKRGAFDKQERELLMSLLEKHGVGRWARIAAEIPHRSDAQCLREWKKLSRFQPSPAQKNNNARKAPRRKGQKKKASSKKRIKRWLIKLEEEEEDSTEEEDEKVVVQYMDSDEEKDKKILEVNSHEEVEEKEFTLSPMEDWIPTEKSEHFTFLSFRPVVLPSTGKGASGTVRSTVVGKFGRSVIFGPSPRVLQWAERHNSNTMMMVSPDQLRAHLHRKAQRFNSQGRVTSLGLRYELQAAVTPWIGNLLIPAKPRLTLADVLREQGERSQLSSTPAFLFFLQTMNVDTLGCKKIIEQRRNKVVYLTPPRDPSSVSRKNPQTAAGLLQRSREMKARLMDQQHNPNLKQLQEVHPPEKNQQQLLLGQQVQTQRVLLVEQPPLPSQMVPQKASILRPTLRLQQPAVKTSSLSLYTPPAAHVAPSLSLAPSTPHRSNQPSALNSSFCHLATPLIPNASVLPSSSSFPAASPGSANYTQRPAGGRGQLGAGHNTTESLSLTRAQLEAGESEQPPLIQSKPAETIAHLCVALPATSHQKTEGGGSAPPPCSTDHDYTFVRPLNGSNTHLLTPPPEQQPTCPSKYNLRQRKPGIVEEQHKLTVTDAGGADGGVTQKGKRIRKLTMKAKALEKSTNVQADNKGGETASSPCKKRRKSHSSQPVPVPTQQLLQLPALCLRPGQTMWVMTPKGLVQLAPGPSQSLPLALISSAPLPSVAGHVSAPPPAQRVSSGQTPVVPKQLVSDLLPSTAPPHRTHPPSKVLETERSSTWGKPADPPSYSSDTLQFDPSLIFLEPQAAVCDWLGGHGGVVVPGLDGALPHLPPFVGSLTTLGALLRAKTSLTKSSLQLLSQGSKPRHLPGKRRRDSSEPSPDLPDSTSDLKRNGDQPAPSISLDEEKELVASVRQLVSERFSANPAYQLLKARFLSFFTVPGLMASIQPLTETTLAPQGGQQQQQQQQEEEDEEVVEIKKIKERRRWRSERSLLLCDGPGAPANHFSGINPPVPEQTVPAGTQPPVQ